MAEDPSNFSTAEKKDSNDSKSSFFSVLGTDSELSRIGYTLLSEKMRTELLKQQKKINEDNKKFHEEFLKTLKEEYGSAIEANAKDLEDKIENSKLSVIETLGMFVALFTFISVDFQVFKSYRDPAAIGALTAILIGAIFLFIIVFDYFILQARKIRKTEKNNDTKVYEEDKGASKARKVLAGLSTVFIIGGLAVFFTTHPEDDVREQIKNEVLQSVESNINAQKIKLEEVNKNNTTTVDNINNNMTTLKKCVKNFGFTYKCFE